MVTTVVTSNQARRSALELELSKLLATEIKPNQTKVIVRHGRFGAVQYDTIENINYRRLMRNIEKVKLELSHVVPDNKIEK